MITVKNLIRRISQMMAAAVLVPLANAAPSSAGIASDGAVTEAADGMALYQAHCAACHDGQVPRAPHMITFATIGAETILNAMNNGVMRAQASALSASEPALTRWANSPVATQQPCRAGVVMLKTTAIVMAQG